MRPALKVLFCTLSEDVWGAEESLLILLSHAESNDIDATVAVGKGSPLVRRLQSSNVRVIEHQFAPHPAHASAGSLSGARKRDLALEIPFLIGGIARARQLIRDFDVVVPFSLWQAAEISIAARLSRTACVLDVHDTFEGRFGKLGVASIARICSATVLPSRVLAGTYGLSGVASIVPRPVVVDMPIPSELLRKDGRITIGIFGQIAPHKRVLELAEELIRADSKGLARLLVVGGQAAGARTQYENSVRELVGQRPDWEVVERQPQVNSLMRECDFVVNVSAHEAFGRTVIEAIVNGSVPLVLHGAGPAEIVSDTGVGRAFPDIASMLRYALDTDETMLDPREMARVGRLYSAEHVARQYYEAIRGTRS